MFHLTRKLMMIATVVAALAGTGGGAALAATSAPAAAAASSVPSCYTQDLSAGLRGAESEGTAEFGQLVVDAGRGLGVGMPGHQPAVLQPAQRVGEHLAGDSADHPGQLTVPARLVGEAVEDHDGPLVSDDLNGQPGRAVGQEHVASGHEPKGTNRFLSAS